MASKSLRRRKRIFNRKRNSKLWIVMLHIFGLIVAAFLLFSPEFQGLATLTAIFDI